MTTWTYAELRRQIAEDAGVLNVANARLIATVQKVLETEAWQVAGIHSPAHWVAWQTGLSIGHAREVVAIAAKRAEFPKIFEAFDSGELAVDQVAVVVKNAPSWADGDVLDFAKVATVQQLRSTMRDSFFGKAPGESGDAETEKVPVDRLSTGNIEGGRWRINGEANAEQGAIIDAALDEARDALFRGGRTDVTNIDALVEMAQRSLNAVGSVSRRERHRVWLHLDVDANISTTRGWKLPSAVAERILCDGVLQPVWEREGIPFNQGRTTRVIPAHLREAIRRRDRGSRAPWDTSVKHTEVHHIIPWSKGGPTETWNLIEISQRVHDLIHQGQLSVEGNADQPNGLIWRDAHGRILDNSGQPVPPGHIPKPAREYQHPEGTRLDRRWLGWPHPDTLRIFRVSADLSASIT